MANNSDVRKEEADATQRRVVGMAVELNRLIAPGVSLSVRIPKSAIITPGQNGEFDVIHITKPALNVDISIK